MTNSSVLKMAKITWFILKINIASHKILLGHAQNFVYENHRRLKCLRHPKKKLDCSIYLSTFSWEALNRFTRCGQDIWTIFWHRKMLKWQAIVLLQSTVSAKSRWKLFSCSFYACTMSMKCTAIRTFFSYAATPPSLPSLFFSEVHS